MLIKEKQKLKTLKKISIIIGLIGVILFLVSWYFNQKYKPVLSKEIKKSINQSTNGLYTLEFTNVSTNFITGHLTLKNVKLNYNQERYNALVEAEKAPNNLVRVELEKLIVKRIDLLNFIVNNDLEINSITLDAAEIDIINKNFNYNTSKTSDTVKSPFQYIEHLVGSLKVKEVKLLNSKFNYFDSNDEVVKKYTVNHININMTDFLLDRNSVRDFERIYFFKDIQIAIKSFKVPTFNGQYDLTAEEIKYQASTGSIQIYNFRISSNFTDNIDQQQKRPLDLKLTSITSKYLDVVSFLKRGVLIADELELSNGKIEIYQDEKFRKANNSKSLGEYKPRLFPQQFINSLNIPINIKNIVFKGLNIDYNVKGLKSREVGEIIFANSSGDIGNVTNIDSLKKRNNLMKLNFQSSLYGQGPLSINIDFDLNSAKSAFKLEGNLINFNARQLNKITKPVALLQINRGYVNHLKFSFNGDYYGTNGQVDFNYFNLSVGLMKKDVDDGRLVKMGLLSFLTNNLMIEGENPKLNGDFVKPKINYVKEENRSIFNLLWKSLFEGIKYSVGLTPNKQLMMKDKIDHFKNIKESREARKRKN